MRLNAKLLGLAVALCLGTSAYADGLCTWQVTPSLTFDAGIRAD